MLVACEMAAELVTVAEVAGERWTGPAETREATARRRVADFILKPFEEVGEGGGSKGEREDRADGALRCW